MRSLAETLSGTARCCLALGAVQSTGHWIELEGGLGSGAGRQVRDRQAGAETAPTSPLLLRHLPTYYLGQNCVLFAGMRVMLLDVQNRCST